MWLWKKLVLKSSYAYHSLSIHELQHLSYLHLHYATRYKGGKKKKETNFIHFFFIQFSPLHIVDIVLPQYKVVHGRLATNAFGTLTGTSLDSSSAKTWPRRMNTYISASKIMHSSIAPWIHLIRLKKCSIEWKYSSSCCPDRYLSNSRAVKFTFPCLTIEI